MNNSTVRLSFLTLFALNSLSANAERWSETNDPKIFEKNYEYRLDALPATAMLQEIPWSETYWATNLGSINIRWNQEKTDGFDYKVPKRSQALRMSRSQLASLSPAEKYDLLLGRYDFPIHKEVDKFASPRVAYWKGLCNGWSITAIQFKEPKPVDLKNPDGIVIPFGSSDIKGLLAYHAQMISNYEMVQVGGYCGRVGGIFGSSDCEDINPGAMHVILTNEIGLRNRAFIMDRDQTREIWNQPVYGYKVEILGSAKSKHAPKAVQVQTTITYTDELEKSSWEPVLGTDKFKSNTLVVKYILELDWQNRIVGGEYLDGSDHPDVFWRNKNPIEHTGDYHLLGEIISSQN